MKIIIKKLEITAFGCLKNTVFTPNEGLNKINSANETGKSTIAAFIKFIFYGFSSSKKDIMDSDKKMYLPWDSPFAAGAAEIEADGVLYRIERKYAPSQKEVLSVFEIQSGKRVFEGQCPGEVFFGVDLETAEGTFIFDQYCALTARNSELFDSIRNIIFSGDENGSSEKAIKRLKDAKKELKNSRGGGIIPTLEKEFDKYKALYDESMGKLEAVKEINEQISKTEKSIERNTVSEKKLLADKENYEKYEAYLKLVEIEELKKEAINAENAYKIAVSSLDGAGIPDGNLLEYLVNLNAQKLSNASLSAELEENLNKSRAETETLKAKLPKGDDDSDVIKENVLSLGKSQKVFYALSAVLGLLGVGAAVGSMFNVPYISYASFGAFAFAAVFCVLAIMRTSKRKKYIQSFGVETDTELFAALNIREETISSIETKEKEIAILEERYNKVKLEYDRCEEELSSVLGKYFKASGEDSAQLIVKLRQVTEKVAQAKKSADSKHEALKKTAELLDITALTQKAEGAVKPSDTIENIEKQLRFVQNGKKLMEDKKIDAEKQKAILESSVSPPSVLFEKAESTYKKLTEAKTRFASLEIALELLEKGSDIMKSTLAPKISAYASELFNIATGGKYKSLNVTTELSLSTDNGETVKSAEYLSAGARATAYICLRLALMKVIFNDTFPPIIFDDAFVRLDKSRLEQVNKAIMSSPAKDTQIFIFQAE